MLCDIVSDCFLVQLVSTNTRQHILVSTNNPDIISSVSVCDSISGTDHDAVNFVIGAQMCTLKLFNHTIICMTITRLIRITLLNIYMRYLIDYNGDIETSWAMWKDLFLSAVD